MRRQQAIDREYVLGHSDEELQRLVRQSRLFGDLTEQLLLKAGIGTGLRVLDVGCGPGDVSFLAAGLVGPSGSVIGVDKSTEAIAVARERASAAQLRNVTFVEGDVSDFSLEGSVDAAVGRFVLQHLPDPVAALRGISRHVKAGGVIAFQEMDASGGNRYPDPRCSNRLVAGSPKRFAERKSTRNWVSHSSRSSGAPGCQSRT
jgi:ubiquinone/menaquinone biosynthesis C-methylase UbiE